MIRYKNLTIIPTYHSNLDFAQEVRAAFYNAPPDAIAVEFPENLSKVILRGAERLPKISLVVYFDEMLQEQLFVPIEPSDSLIEGIRLGMEYGIPVEFIDLFVKNYTPIQFAQPDSYVLNQIPLEDFYKLYRDTLHLDKWAEAKFQAEQIRNYLASLKKAKDEESLESENPEGEDSLDSEKKSAWQSDPVALDNLRNQYMASRLHELMQNHKNILVIMGLAHWDPIRVLLEHDQFDEDITSLMPDINPELFNVEQDDLPKIMIETPNMVWQWEQYRSRQKDLFDELEPEKWATASLGKYSQSEGIQDIFSRALERYHKEYNERVSPQKLKAIVQYLRNLPLADHMLSPKLFEIVLASKGIVNDDFAWIVWDECKRYPEAQMDPKLESLQFSDDGIFLHGKHFKLRRSIPVKLTKIKVPLKPKPGEKYKGEWEEEWKKNRWNLVSHIPEDFFEENYFQHVRHRSLNLLKDQFVKLHKFTSTLMDGIDFRETIRNWATDHTIFVREERPIQGEVDAVVIIFDRDEGKPQRYPYQTVWYAEHEHESDLALYSTPPGQILEGPGISRVELGGVVSFFPPRGIPDIWFEKKLDLPDLGMKKADRLLLAGIYYSKKNFVVYVAESPPRSAFYSLAQKFNQKILYIPLDRFNPVSLRALRNLHMLAGKHTRKFAARYIKKRRY